MKSVVKLLSSQTLKHVVHTVTIMILRLKYRPIIYMIRWNYVM
jgi:hypothetical protein